MSLLGELTAKGLSLALGTALKASPLDAGTISSALSMVGAALQDLALKLKDGKIDEAEIEDTLAKVGALGNDSVALAAKAAVGRILEQIL
jgi:hypothetical protein